jgi:uncharacterized protein YwqG
MAPIQRKTILAAVEDRDLRKIAEEHPDFLHPCVWLVKDEEGPLNAGGRPILPAGREWPKAQGKLLTYLMAIDTALLPEWSPLPRNTGHLLIFVAHNICEMVVVASGVKTQETEPPREEYLSGEPIAGEVLESQRFRLEEGLHAGLSTSWSPSDSDTSTDDSDLMESLTELNRALKPEHSFSRLFGHHEWWTDADPVTITRYSYLSVNGFPYGWYANLEGSVKNLQQKLEQAKAQSAAIEPLPMMAESVVQACEKWVAEVEQKVIDRKGLTAPDVRKKITKGQAALALRQKRWQEVKAKDPEAANRALEELMDSTSEIDREMEHIPIINDPERFKAQVAAMEDQDAEQKLRASQRAMASLKEEARIRKEFADDPAGLEAALKKILEPKGKSVYSQLLALLTPMQYACQKNDLVIIRRTWNDFEQKLNDCASELKASQLATALHWRLHGYESLKGWSRQEWTDPQEIAGKIAAIQWWQADVQKHMAELSYWRPLLVMDSDSGPYFWGDAGWAIILADQRQVADANLHRLAIAVDVS